MTDGSTASHPKRGSPSDSNSLKLAIEPTSRDASNLGRGCIPAHTLAGRLVADCFDESQRLSFIRRDGRWPVNRSTIAARQRRQSKVTRRRARPITPCASSPARLEIGPGVTVKTLAYNGQVPGPLLRLREGSPVTIDVTNAAHRSGHRSLARARHRFAQRRRDGRRLADDRPRPDASLHVSLPSPRARAGITPTPALTAISPSGTYTGQFGFLLIEGKDQPAHYDQEINLAIHHWEPSFVPMVETMREQSANMPLTTGSDVGYKYATINSHMLGAGEPIRVKQGQRVLMRLLNASATENVVLALPGHRFTRHRDGRQSRCRIRPASRCCRWPSPSASTPSWR